MKILVDADACPNVIKEIIYRASKRLNMTVYLFANHYISIPKSPYLKFHLVSKGFDKADEEIEKLVEKNDLVITADILLADQVIHKGATAINVRGMVYTEENIKERLRVRNMMEEIRSTGKMTGGPAPLNKKDQQSFANALDRHLSKR